ncbi:DUF4907 domain-containing protein [Bacteroides sp.]
MKKNKRRIPVYIGLITLFLSGIWWYRPYDEETYHLQVIELEGGQGYGYKINKGKQTVVYQPFVPALSHRKPFLSAEEAAKVGRLVLERLKLGQDFSVMEEDLKLMRNE